MRKNRVFCLTLKTVVVFLFAALSAGAQSVTVTGNLKTLGVQNVTANGTFVRFSLRNFDSQIPTVPGTTSIAWSDQDFVPDGNGNISGNLFTDASIQPVGTFYHVCIWFRNQLFRCNDYLINGPFNLNTATPLITIVNAGPGVIITQCFTFTQNSASATWTIVHNLGDANVLAEAWNGSGVLMIPNTTTKTDFNTLTMTFITPQTGTATVCHSGPINIATNQPNALLSNPPGNQTTLFDLSTAGSFTAPAFRSASANIAIAGNVRLATGDTVCWRNNANTADLCLNKNASDNLFFGSHQFPFLDTANSWTLTQTFVVPAAFTQATGTAPFTVASTTNVSNLNSSFLLGNTWAAPGPIGGTTPGSGAFTTVTGTSFSGNSFSSLSANPAASGVIRCASADACVVFRNNANSGDISFAKNTSDQPTFGGFIVPTILNAVTPGHFATFASSGQIQDGGSALPVIQKIKKVTGCTPPSGSSFDACSDTLTWPVAFADTTYAITCTGKLAGANGGNPGTNQTDGLFISSYTTTQVVVITQNLRGAASNFDEIHCIGVR